MIRKLLFGALLLLAPVPAAAAEPRPLADSLIPAYANAADAKRLGTLMRLQFEAGRWDDAERSAERAFAMMPWRIYARARRYQAEGASWPNALARAFAELYGSLSDQEVARTYGWMGGNMDGLRQTLAQAERACPDKPIDHCDGAADIIAARQSIIAWEHLQPALEPLLRADTEHSHSAPHRCKGHFAPRFHHLCAALLWHRGRGRDGRQRLCRDDRLHSRQGVESWTARTLCE
jgi:hypothetical protein